MKLLTRYLIRRLSVSTLLALFALLALYSFLDLINEVGSIGTNNYTGATAFFYVLMKTPAHAYQLMPLAVLIGGLFAFSQLAGSSEMAVIKTSGMSSGQIIRIALGFSLIFATATACLGEWLAPELSRRADTMKNNAKTGRISSAANGLWIKQSDSMVYIAEMLPDHSLHGIKIWRYGSNFKLTEAVAAQSAVVHTDHWLLQDAQSSRLDDNAVHTSREAQRRWPNNIGGKLLDILLVKPEQMPLSALTGYIRYLEDNGQQTQEYRVAWWNKLVYPIATIVMALVALAFTPQSGRHTNMGLRLFAGVCLGLLFFFAGQFFGFTTRLYGVPAFVSATLPTLAFALWAVYLIRKQERR